MSQLKLSAAGLALLKASEGFRGATYLDVAGFPTIGYGHRILPGEKFPAGVTEPEASTMLATDVNKAEQAVLRQVRATLTQGQFDALVDFVYNLGAARLATSTLLKDLNAGQHDAAASQLLQWDHAGGKENSGLKKRRLAEFALWHGPAVPVVPEPVKS